MMNYSWSCAQNADTQYGVDVTELVSKTLRALLYLLSRRFEEILVK